MKPCKAIFPVAGLGTRFLPATKATPKEMLPIVDKPLIQYAVEEALSAGFTEIIFVTSSNKRTIEDHFDSNFELEAKLANANKHDMLTLINNIIPKGAQCTYIRQPEAKGLGHAVLCAKHLINNEPFAVLLADDLIEGNGHSCMQQLVEIYTEHQTSVIAVEEINPNETDKYGIIGTENPTATASPIKKIVEKPVPAEAPSNLAAIGRYIFTPQIMALLETTQPGVGGEIQLTDAIAALLTQEEILSYRFSGTRFDCGSHLGYLQATVAYGLKHPSTKQPFLDYLKNLNIHNQS